MRGTYDHEPALRGRDRARLRRVPDVRAAHVGDPRVSGPAAAQGVGHRARTRCGSIFLNFVRIIGLFFIGGYGYAHFQASHEIYFPIFLIAMTVGAWIAWVRRATHERSAAASPRPKPRALFAAHAIALALLIGFWPTPRQPIPRSSTRTRTRCFAALDRRTCGSRRRRRTRRSAPTRVLRSSAPGAAEPAWQAWFSLERIGYWPSAALLALLFATPLAPARRAVAVAARARAARRCSRSAASASRSPTRATRLEHGPGAPAPGRCTCCCASGRSR